MSMDVMLQTRQWIERVVIAHNFCPFAKRPLSSGAVHFSAVASSKRSVVIDALLAECLHLDQQAQLSTTIIVLSHGFAQWGEYLDLVDVCNKQLLSNDYEGVYQLASFHPDYVFAGADVDDAANYTNRSPYPLLHILREAELTHMIDSYAQVDNIPERNICHARALGNDYFRAEIKQLLKDI